MRPLVIRSFVVPPADIGRAEPEMAAAQSDLASIVAPLPLLRGADRVRRGAASRRACKLTGGVRPAHRVLHRPPVAGLEPDLASAVLAKTEGIVPIAAPPGPRRANEIAGGVHPAVFRALAAVVAAHAVVDHARATVPGGGALRFLSPRARRRSR